VRSRGIGIQIGAKVELCGQEGDSEQQCADTGPIGFCRHLLL